MSSQERRERCQAHEYYKRLEAIYAGWVDRESFAAFKENLLRLVAHAHYWADLRAPHSLHTNGYRRQRRKHGRHWGRL